MIQYFFESLMGVLLLSGLMILCVGSSWVLVVAIKELLETLGVNVKWIKNGGNVQQRKELKSGRLRKNGWD